MVCSHLVWKCPENARNGGGEGWKKGDGRRIPGTFCHKCERTIRESKTMHNFLGKGGSTFHQNISNRSRCRLPLPNRNVDRPGVVIPWYIYWLLGVNPFTCRTFACSIFFGHLLARTFACTHLFPDIYLLGLLLVGTFTCETFICSFHMGHLLVGHILVPSIWDIYL